MTITENFDLFQYLKSFILLDNTMEVPKKSKIKRTTLIENENFDKIAEPIPKFTNEFWTSKQRQSSSIHEISYRACFKAQLPGFFIRLFSKKNDIVYDPFSGRGTTIIEAGILGRNIISNDINPLNEILAKPRLEIPNLIDIEKRLEEITFNKTLNEDNRTQVNLSMFYHKDTKEELENLRLYLKKQKNSGEEDNIDRWIRMVATNRLTGHSSGFFSVYTLPPNQAVSAESQIKINIKRQQVPPYRNIKKLILKKSKSLLRNVTKEQKKNLLKVGKKAIFLQKDARNTPKIANKTVQLTITSPPFLNIVQYSKDNWLRCWFNSINVEEISKKITMAKKIETWTDFMIKVFQELYRITKFNGWVAFEVGEIQKGKIKLDDYIVPIGIDAGFKCRGILINSQKFTKTSNIWGIKNNLAGTNTNRIVLFEKTY